MPTGAGTKSLLVCVACLAFAHALTWATVRPLYQVSDEINYAFSAQREAYAMVSTDAQRACVAPPDGLLYAPQPGGKAGFAAVTGRTLAWLCGSGGTFPLLALRALQALSLPVVALCAWQMAWLLTRHRATAFVAATIVALHPVAATQAGAITPDAWANAWSALTLLAGTRILLRRQRWWDWPLLIGGSLVALAWKDTAHFLLLHGVLVLGVAALTTFRRRDDLSSGWTRRSRVLAGTAAVALAVPGVMAGRDVLVSPYLAGYDLSRVTAAPMSFAGRVVDDALVQSAGMLLTSLTAVGSFGANTFTLPTGPAVVLLCFVALAVAGVFVHIVAPRLPRPPQAGIVLVVWLLAGLACALQPSLRQALLGSGDVHQGRWLLPMLAPAATVAALGLTTLLRTTLLPVVVVVWCGATLVTLGQTVSYFHEAFPACLDHSMLFLRATAGELVDDAGILRAIESVQSTLDATLAWSILLAMVAACGCASWQACRLTHSDDHV